ncbi:MAG: cytochrome c-type biogenesis protein CcmH [Candidatus Eisenbacteria bacterium]|uniref:Cytochrome c-type biogenesis protein n=1 Tax=Eiseniibacteriota bacterium TaxID=2212470 RepID=A0A956LXP7_UNCEI|nr:cytochrome c-type biogenesis protein CcmH [Candidatus Eisenbacteria bacterium]
MKTWKRNGLMALLGIGLVLAISAGTCVARAADIPTLEKELINPCPNCGGMPLAGSYCGGAAEAKAKIRTLAAAGKTDQEILDAFVAEYGEWILVTPPRRGFNLMAWFLPLLGIVIGSGGLALFLRRARGGTGNRSESPRPPAPEPAADPSRNRYREILRRELGEI